MALYWTVRGSFFGGIWELLKAYGMGLGTSEVISMWSASLGSLEGLRE